jgi:hypothetical protein
MHRGSSRTSRRHVPVVLVAAASLLTGLSWLSAGAARAGTGAPRSWDAQLTFDPHYAEGEPSVAVNPVDPANIIVTYLADTYLGVPGLYHGQAPDARDVEQPIQGCQALVSFDGGRTWTTHQLPIASFQIDPIRPNCSDTLVAFDHRGVAYVMGSSYQFPGFVAGAGDFRMTSSRDGGRTWSKPSVISPTLLGPGADPAAWQGARFYDDRPFMAIDDSTGTIYVDGTQGRATASGPEGDTEYLTSSSDGGRTWTDALGIGTASPAPLGAAFGMVAFTNPPPAGASRACSCVDFVVSTDRAHSFVRRPTPIPAGSGLFGPETAADPLHRGRFVVLASDASGRNAVYRTADAGRTWSGPTTFGVPGTTVNEPWLAFSPTGVLAVGWKAAAPDGSYAYYATVSYDGGRSFAPPVRISRAPSPAPDPVVPAGDDTTSVAVLGGHLYAAWGDWRGKNLQTWWGGFPVRPAP